MLRSVYVVTIHICYTKFNFMNHSLYFQAYVTKNRCWILTATMNYCEHLAFDRTIDKEQSIFEFFVSSELEDVFIDVMITLQKAGVVKQFEKLPNRIMDHNE